MKKKSRIEARNTKKVILYDDRFNIFLLGKNRVYEQRGRFEKLEGRVQARRRELRKKKEGAEKKRMRNAQLEGERYTSSMELFLLPLWRIFIRHLI